MIPSISSVKFWFTACGQLEGDLVLCCAAQPIRREDGAAELEKRREGGMEELKQLRGKGRYVGRVTIPRMHNL